MCHHGQTQHVFVFAFKQTSSLCCMKFLGSIIGQQHVRVWGGSWHVSVTAAEEDQSVRFTRCRRTLSAGDVDVVGLQGLSGLLTSPLRLCATESRAHHLIGRVCQSLTTHLRTLDWTSSLPPSAAPPPPPRTGLAVYLSLQAFLLHSGSFRCKKCLLFNQAGIKIS